MEGRHVRGVKYRNRDGQHVAFQHHQHTQCDLHKWMEFECLLGVELVIHKERLSDTSREYL